MNADQDYTNLVPEYRAYLQGKVIAICEAVLNDEIGIIAASRILDSLGNQLVGVHHDDFMLFLVISSETDHLPVDYDRKNWNPDALKKKDQEILDNEAFYRDKVVEQCKFLIAKYGMTFH